MGLNDSDLGMMYHETGQYKKEKKLYKKAEQDFPDDSASDTQARLYWH